MLRRSWCGWHHNKTFNVMQKVNGSVFVYLTPMLFDQYMMQLYLRGSEKMGVCQLEVRTSNSDKIEQLVQLGEIWLQKYNDGDLEKISKDLYYIANPHGAWGKPNQDYVWI